MKYILKLITELPKDIWQYNSEIRSISIIEGYLDQETQYETTYYFKHDSIGHQWTPNLHLAKRFDSIDEVKQLSKYLIDYNYEGTHVIEECMDSRINTLLDI